VLKILSVFVCLAAIGCGSPFTSVPGAPTSPSEGGTPEMGQEAGQDEKDAGQANSEAGLCIGPECYGMTFGSCADAGRVVINGMVICPGPADDGGTDEAQAPDSEAPDSGTAIDPNGACIQAACADANPARGGANCGVLPGVTCGGLPVDCSQGKTLNGCASAFGATSACGGSGIPNQCGDACLSTVPQTDACGDAYLPSKWGVSAACNTWNGTPYTIAEDGGVTFRPWPVSVLCQSYGSNQLLCCN